MRPARRTPRSWERCRSSRPTRRPRAASASPRTPAASQYETRTTSAAARRGSPKNRACTTCSAIGHQRARGGEDHPRAVLTLSIAAAHRDSGQTQRINQRVEVEAGPARAGATRTAPAWDEGWLALSRELDLVPGVTQARIVIRDEFLGRLGALTLRFVVPPPASLRLSTPVITNRVSAAREGLPSRPVLVAHREFPSGDRLYCQFEVFGAAPRSGPGSGVEASYELRRRDGEVMRRGEPSLVSPSADGRILRLLALPLDGIAPGDYELVLR